MRQKPGTKQSHGEKVVKDIRRATRKQYSAEEKIRIVLDGLKGEDSIAELCHSACHPKGLRFRLDERSVAVHSDNLYLRAHCLRTSTG
jgi:hypothetical protein